MSGWEIVKDATFKLTGDYRVVDEKGNTVMADTAYYPQAPEYDEALRIVNAINELEAKDATIAELLEVVRMLHQDMLMEGFSSEQPSVARAYSILSKAKLNTPNDTGV